MGSTHSQERRLKKDLPVIPENTDICERNEVLAQIQFIDNTLVAADVNTSAQHMHGGLDRGIDCDLRDNVGEYLAFIIIIKAHITSLWVPLISLQINICKHFFNNQ